MQFKSNFFMQRIRPKKFLGQHFLKDLNIAGKIVNSLSYPPEKETIIEIGPGTGVLTGLLANKEYKKIILIEIDRESIALLQKEYTGENIEIVEGDLSKYIAQNDFSDLHIRENR